MDRVVGRQRPRATVAVFRAARLLLESEMDEMGRDPMVEYITAPEPGLSLRQLAAKYEVPLRQMQKRCARERWVEQRELHRSKGGDGKAADAAGLQLVEGTDDVKRRHRVWWSDLGRAVHRCIRKSKQKEKFEDVRTLEMIGKTFKLATDGERVALGLDEPGEQDPKRIAIEWLFPDAHETDQS